MVRDKVRTQMMAEATASQVIKIVLPITPSTKIHYLSGVSKKLLWEIIPKWTSPDNPIKKDFFLGSFSGVLELWSRLRLINLKISCRVHLLHLSPETNRSLTIEYPFVIMKI
jgi:hypothetical protein